MSDSTSLGLLLELVSNPLMMSNFFLYKSNPEDIDEIARDNPSLAKCMEDLGRTVEVALKYLAERQIEIGKHKYIQTDKEINPNQKFINNQVLIKLEENEERLSFTSKHQELKWEAYDELLVKTFQRMSAGKRYQDFMKEEGYSFEEGLAKCINNLWECLTSEEKQQVKGILE